MMSEAATTRSGCTRLARRAVLAALVTVAAAPSFAADITPQQEQFFETRIRPLLVDNCYQCHGPDKQKSSLRLDSRGAILKGGDSGEIVTPGSPDTSLLVKAIRHDGDITMPPKKKLTDEQIAAVEAWVKMGLPWPGVRPDAPPVAVDPFEAARQSYWSLQPVTKPQPPAVPAEAPVYNDIDRFVIAKLRDAGLSPAPTADRAALIRRAHFDLIGLPPTYEQVQTFVNDPASDDEAWSKLIDELLASPHYGERWGRHWLDVARYADTKGYIGVGVDMRYPYSYTYRDYVIRAFNSDKPYDRFIMEQLAADKLNERGELSDKRDLAAMGFLTVGRRFINNEQEIIDDRIDVTMRGFQALTVACARCHDHKYDPIPTEDYYSLYGVFASSREPDDKDLPVIGEPQQSDEYDKYQAELAKRQKAVDDYLRDIRRKAMDESRQRVTLYLYELVREDERFKPSHDKLPERDANKLRRRIGEQWQEWIAKWDGKHHAVFSVWHWFAKLDQSNFADAAAAMVAQFDELEKQRGALNPLVKRAFTASPPKSMADVAATLGKLVEDADRAWRDAIKQDAKLTALPDAAAEQVRQAIYGDDAPTFVPDDLGVIARFTRRDEREHYRNLDRAVDQLRASSPVAPPRAMVMVDDKRLYDPVVFERGQRNRRGKQVPRRFPQLLAHVDGGKTWPDSSGRLELARAIAGMENPLTARVFVNRAWHHHFGVGLVRTNSDFGVRSVAPVHKDLLDYLAARFMEDAWSIKKLHKLIMMSRTYRQTSSVDDATNPKSQIPNPKSVDPENNLLWRFNRQRLEFEPLRDTLLLVAGRLDRTMGGRTVDIIRQPFTTRRTVYGYIDRQNVPGLFYTFDMPVPEASAPKRPNTTTPQQALFLMNSPFAMEQVKHLAARIDAALPVDKQVQQLYGLVLSRDATDDEARAIAEFVQGTEQVGTPRWQYGYGSYDAEAQRVVSFTNLPHWTGSSWQGGPQVPDGKLHWLFFNRDEAHVGVDHAHAAVRRWTAPADGVIRIDATLRHAGNKGDGVRAWIVSGRQGRLGAWEAHDEQVATNIARIEVKAGETIDFVTDCNREHSYDSFTWNPVLTALDGGGQPTQRRWDAAADFGQDARNAQSLTPLEQAALAMLMSNEFMFVD